MKYSFFGLLAASLLLVGCGTTTPNEIEDTNNNSGVVVEEDIEVITTGDIVLDEEVVLSGEDTMTGDTNDEAGVFDIDEEPVDAE